MQPKRNKPARYTNYLRLWQKKKEYDEERRQYESSLKEYWDYTSTLDTAYMKGEKAGEEKGRAEGREEGRAEGREDEKTDTARRMKAKGFATEDIAEITGLTTEEIERL